MMSHRRASASPASVGVAGLMAVLDVIRGGPRKGSEKLAFLGVRGFSWTPPVAYHCDLTRMRTTSFSRLPFLLALLGLLTPVPWAVAQEAESQEAPAQQQPDENGETAPAQPS